MSLRSLFKAQQRKRGRSDTEISTSSSSTAASSSSSSHSSSSKEPTPATTVSSKRSSSILSSSSSSSSSPQPEGRSLVLRSKSASSLKRPESSSRETGTKKARTQLSDVASSGQKSLEDTQQKLAGAQFRWLNEQLYTQSSAKALHLFRDSPELFDVYHEGFRKQAEQWPIHPLDRIITAIRKMQTRPESTSPLRIGDIGCGEARLAQTLMATAKLRQQFQVHSFDLVSPNEFVVVADMANLPLPADSLDVAVFCLALMGTNINDFINEAYRTLTDGGTLYIAEVQSRFESSSIQTFIAGVTTLGFKLVSQQELSKIFVMFTFTKVSRAAAKSAKKARQIALKPCRYKKR